MRKREISRRDFLRRGSAAGALGLAAPRIVPAAALGRDSACAPSERIHLGIIGAGSMGMGNLGNCARYDDVQVVAVCDVWKARRERALAAHPGAKGYDDHRELLRHPGLDAVIIATPPHWHALQAVEACEAGIDLFLQKPMTLYPAESLAVRNAVRKHGRICQIGTQIHAGAHYRRVVEIVRSKQLGKVSLVRTFNVMNQGSAGLGRPADSAPPAGLDWERWVGPAPLRPFNATIVRDAYHHCSFWDFSGGWTPGMAPHIVDLPCWALGLGHPLVTSCSGGRYAIDDLGDVPDTQEVTWSYPGLTMTWSMSMVNSFGFDFGRGTRARRLGIYFHGVNGTLFSDYGHHEIVPEGDYLPEASPPAHPIPPSPGHEREWLDCIRSRRQPSCSPEYHIKIDLALTLANLSYRLGRSLRLDPEREEILGDDEARRLARPTYRDPWKFPARYL